MPNNSFKSSVKKIVDTAMETKKMFLAPRKQLQKIGATTLVGDLDAYLRLVGEEINKLKDCSIDSIEIEAGIVDIEVAAEDFLREALPLRDIGIKDLYSTLENLTDQLSDDMGKYLDLLEEMKSKSTNKKTCKNCGSKICA